MRKWHRTQKLKNIKHMRTKTLLLTAALSAAGVAASMAQVYSVNVVGYVNVTVPAGKLMILANPLSNGANAIDTVLPLANSADGANVFRFNPTTQAFLDPVSFIADYGWYPTDNNPTLAPGEGFFIQAPAGSPLAITFVGEVPQGDLSYPLAGGGRLTLVGSMVPQEINVGDTTQAGTMNFPAFDGDNIFLWDIAKQSYTDPYSYIQDYGWYAQADENPAGPKIPVGSGFWIQKAGSAPAVNWTRTFNVQ